MIKQKSLPAGRQGFTLVRSAGFTLVEILVVIAVTSVLLLILTQIFFSSLRGNNKAQVLGLIKQNGQGVLDSLDKSIRSADGIVCPAVTTGTTSADSSTLVIIKNGIFTRYRFTGGGLDQDTPVQDLQNPNQKNINDFIKLNLCNEQDPLQVPTLSTITDNNTMGVLVTDGVFTRDQSKGFKDVVTIDFKLSPGTELAKKTFGQIDPVSFKTSVELR